MTTFADAVGRVFQIGFDASIKSGIILALATLVTTFARGSSAATRHRVWSLALVSCLTMPLVCLFLPQIQIPILPTGQASFTSRLSSRADSLPTRTNHAENTPLQFQPVQALSESSRPLLSPKIPEAVPNNSPVAWPDREMTATTFPLLPLILLGGWSFCVLAIWSALIVAIAHIQNVTTGAEGKFSLKLDRTDVSYCLLIEAEGYRATVGRPFHITSGDHREDFKLETTPLLKGRVLDLQGHPLKGAQVHLATVMRPLQYDNENQFMGRPPYVTGDDGHFQFIPQTGPYKVVAIHAQGYRRLDFDQDVQPGDIQLQPWARIEGTLWQEGRPVPNATILLQALREKAFDQSILRESRQVKTNASGRFIFPMIPPSRVLVRPSLSVWAEYPITSNLDDDAAPAGEFAIKEQLVWDHAYVGIKSEAARRLGLSSVPTYLIVSAAGKLVVRTTDWNAAEAELKKLVTP